MLIAVIVFLLTYLNFTLDVVFAPRSDLWRRRRREGGGAGGWGVEGG